MRLELLYFAVLRDLMARERETLTLGDSARTLADLIEHLERATPLAGKLTSVRFAINMSFAEPSQVLNDGDTVALIPPTAGG
jgi:molybdopterin converting factor subunit 1